MRCGLLGRKLGHSYSPVIHSFLGTYDYDLFEKEPEELADFLKNGDFTGLNVTMPYKKAVIPCLDELSPTARKMGCVNTIVRRPDGSLFGHNTDYFGFITMVKKSGIQVTGKKALVLGSGGASCAARNGLLDLGAEVVIISRSGENNYQNLSRHADAAVIVNTTPVGMYPNTGLSPVDLRGFPRLEGVLDVVYNPSRTRLLLDAQSMGLPWENGLWMLVAQAKEASECFTGAALDDGLIAAIHRRMSILVGNVVLIGMPGCGKTTVGQFLAQAMHRSFADADAEIVRLAGMSIPEIFARDGEAGFRQLETRVLGELGKQSGLVIATGGGCVTQAENLSLLRQNGRIFWLQRELSLLPTEGRPLSQATSLKELYNRRKPLYEAFCDHSIHNNGTVAEAAAAILACLEGTQ